MKKLLKVAWLVAVLAVCLAVCGGAAGEEDETTTLPRPDFTMAQTFDAGEPIVFTNNSALTDETYINAYLYRLNTDTDIEFVNSAYIDRYSQSLISIVPYGLDEGNYRLDAVMHRYSSGYSEPSNYYFTVTDPRPAAPNVVILNPSDDIPLLRSKNYMLQVNCHDGSIMQQFMIEYTYNYNDDRPWWRTGGPTTVNSSVAEYSMYSNNSDNGWVRFRVKVNDRWSAYSDVLELQWKTNGQLVKPNLTVPTSFKAGEPVTFVLNNSLIADHMTITVTKYNEANNTYSYAAGAYCGSDEIRQGGAELMAVDLGLDAGSYRLECDTSKTDYIPSETATYDFVVTGERPTGTQVTLSADSITPGETVNITVKANGLEAVQLVYLEKNYLATRNQTVINVRPSYTRDYELCALINGCWTDYFRTDEITVAEGEDLHLSDIVPYLDGKTATVGEDFRFKMDIDPRAEIFTVSIVQVDNSDEGRDFRQVVYEIVLDVDKDGYATIPKDWLNIPGTYGLSFNAYAEGLEPRFTGSYYLEVVEKVTSSITVTVEPQIPSTRALFAGEDLPVTISAEGATKAMLLVKWYRDDGEYYYSYHDENIVMTNGTATMTIDGWYFDQGTYGLSAMAYVNGHWTDWSDEVTVHVAAGNITSLPDVNILTCPEEVVSGEPFTVTWETVAGAEKYLVSYHVGDATVEGSVTVAAPANSASITITSPENQLVRYDQGYVYVVALASMKEASYSDSLFFTFFDSAKPELMPNKSAFSKGETVTLTVSGLKANDLQVKIDGVNKGHMTFRTVNNSGKISLAFNSSGDHTIQVRVRNNVNEYDYGMWSQWSDPVTITVTSTISGPTLVIPSGTKTIEAEAFMGTDATCVEINSGCVTIEDRAFANCPNLLQVTIPSSVTSIEGNPFEGCDASLVIITPAGSKADTFATAHGYTVQRP